MTNTGTLTGNASGCRQNLSQRRKHDSMSSNTGKSATQRLLKFLKSGNDITVRQAQTRFGITNVSARISELKKAGYAVYLNTKTTQNGRTIRAYRLGTPTRRMVAIANFVTANPNTPVKRVGWVNDRATRNLRNATV